MDGQIIIIQLVEQRDSSLVFISVKKWDFNDFEIFALHFNLLGCFLHKTMWEEAVMQP